VYHVVHAFANASIEIVIGMGVAEGIPRWDHLEYIRLVNTTNRIRVRYYIGTPPVHAKGVIWSGRANATLAYMGSANFSWNGFRDNREVMAPVDSTLALVVFPADDELIDCTDENVHNRIRITNPDQAIQVPSSLRSLAENSPRVNLNLYYSQHGLNIVHERSGLNWGQRVGREPSQAYIPVPLSVHTQQPDFFPEWDREFSVITDDGESFVCVVAQQNRKAIETRYDNSILGRYFRRRIGLADGAPVTMDHLEGYGRSSVTIYKLNSDTYYLDFSMGDR
jgi:hypothetical protein